MAHKRREHDYDLEVPWALIDGDLAHALDDDEDSEQHKRRRGLKMRKKSIRHYRHATSKWGAALESFKPIWVSYHHCNKLLVSNLHIVRDSHLNGWSLSNSRLALPLFSTLATPPSFRPLRFRDRLVCRLFHPPTSPLDYLPTRRRSTCPIRPR
jgi:hypothetical protein